METRDGSQPRKKHQDLCKSVTFGIIGVERNSQAPPTPLQEEPFPSPLKNLCLERFRSGLSYNPKLGFCAAHLLWAEFTASSCLAVMGKEKKLECPPTLDLWQVPHSTFAPTLL